MGEQVELLDLVIVDRGQEVPGPLPLHPAEPAAVVLDHLGRVLGVADLVLRAAAVHHRGVAGAVAGDAQARVLASDVLQERHSGVNVDLGHVTAPMSLRAHAIIIVKQLDSWIESNLHFLINYRRPVLLDPKQNPNQSKIKIHVQLGLG